MKEIHIFGKDVNIWVVVGSLAGVVTVYYLYKKNSGVAAGSSSAIDPLTGLPYSQDAQVDPLTGMTYLTEAQQYGSVQAAEAAISSGQAYSGGYYNSGGGYSGSTAGSPSLSGNGTATGSGYASNAQWAQAVTNGLTSIGYSSTDVAAALGLYLSGQSLGIAPDGVSYLSIVQAAVAEFGPPPVGTFTIIAGSTNPPPPSNVSVPNVVGLTVSAAETAITNADLTPSLSGGTDPVVSQNPAAGSQVSPTSTVTITGTTSTGGGGGGTPPPASATVPNVVGMTIAAAENAISNAGLVTAIAGGTADPVIAQSPAAGTSVPQGSAVSITATTPSSGGGGSTGRLTAPTGLHLTIQGRTGVRLQWNSVSGATSYICQNKRGGENGTSVNGPFSVSGPVCNFGSLTPNTKYTALIWPSDASDPGGPGSNQPHAQFYYTTPS